MLQTQANWSLPGMMPGWMAVPVEVITPPVDILEGDSEIIYIFAIPGVGPQEVRVEIQQHILEIEAVLPHYQDSNQYTYLYRERPQGRYYRLMTLPLEIDSEKAVANFNQGLLEIRFPRITGGRPIKINVKPQVQKRTKPGTATKIETTRDNPLI